MRMIPDVAAHTLLLPRAEELWICTAPQIFGSFPFVIWPPARWLDYVAIYLAYGTRGQEVTPQRAPVIELYSQ